MRVYMYRFLGCLGILVRLRGVAWKMKSGPRPGPCRRLSGRSVSSSRCPSSAAMTNANAAKPRMMNKEMRCHFILCLPAFPAVKLIERMCHFNRAVIGHPPCSHAHALGCHGGPGLLIGLL